MASNVEIPTSNPSSYAYPYPSPNLYLSAELSRSNYRVWKAQIVCLPESQDLLGFVDGTITSPSETGADDVQWKRTDRLVKGWILACLAEEILQRVVHEVTARDVWLQLDLIFDPPLFQEGGEEDSEEDNNGEEDTEDHHLYLPLYRASLSENWKEAEPFFRENNGNKASRAALNSELQTALHIAVGAKNDNAKHFVEQLVNSIPPPLDMKDNFGCTPLHYAALFGNLDAAKILVARDKDLPNIAASNILYPIHTAARNAYHSPDMYIYLLGVTTVRDAFKGNNGRLLVCRLMLAEKYDLATELVEQYPHTAKPDSDQLSPLMDLAEKEFALLRGDGLNSWQRLLFRYVPIRSTSEGQKRIPTDIENVSNEPQMFNAKNCWLSPIWERIYFGAGALITKLGGLSFDVLERLVPHLKLIRDKKSGHHNALKLVECLCKKIENLSFVEVRRIAGAPLLAAAKNDNYEFVEAIVRKFPSLISIKDVTNEKNIFHLAIEHRCENVFNLVHRMSQRRAVFMGSLDSSGNTMLHLAAKLAPKNKLNLVPGAALQMQRELQWFKEVRKFVLPDYWERHNGEKKMPSVIFTEEHVDLKIKGEEWMKGTANSCTIAAALITTIAFAAAITVPGGNYDETGLPIFAKNGAFIVFAISNAASLFTSTTSLLVFLSILTSRYAEEDFLYALPRSLILGLLTLFLSITLMTVSFSAAVYIVLGQKKAYVLVPVAIMACLPIMSFVLLQTPLIVALISSTWRGISGKKSNRPFY